MKNKAKRLLTAMLVGTLSFASVFATDCKKNKVPDTEQTLEVFAAKLGYGASWCEAELNAFKEEDWVKEKYPNLNVIFEANADRSAISTRLSAGAGRNTVDLIFSDSVTPFMGKERAGTEYSCNLTDTVYNTKVPGEDITVYDKLLDTYKEALVYYNAGESALEEKEFVSYDFNWASGMRGILYNQELLDSFGYKTAPRTSDELIEMSAKISADKGSYNKGYAFMWSGEADYIEDMYNVWWAQYEGYQQIYNYYNGIFYDGRNYVEKSSKIFEQEGREKALNALIGVMSNAKGYMYPYGSSVKFKAAQKSFIEGNGVFMSNGDWFAEEMKEDIAKSNYTIRMMRSPVISAIKDKTSTVTTDEQLRTIVSRIDAGCATISEALAATPEAGDADGPAIYCGHAWTIWRAEADYLYYALTGDEEYLIKAKNGFGTNFAKIRPDGVSYSIYNVDDINGGGFHSRSDDVIFKIASKFASVTDSGISRYVWIRAIEPC